MPFTVDVDKDLCISSGRCVADAPRVFRFDEDEISEPTGEVGAVDDDELVDIAHNCPSGAIRVYDGDREVSG